MDHSPGLSRSGLFKKIIMFTADITLMKCDDGTTMMGLAVPGRKSIYVKLTRAAFRKMVKDLDMVETQPRLYNPSGRQNVVQDFTIVWEEEKNKNGK
jgi:hypothetical protein